MRASLLFAAVLAGCAQAPAPAPDPEKSASRDSVVPGTIGVLVRQQDAAVVVSAAREGSGVRAGDVVLRYNGEAVTGVRQFYRLVVDSRPGGLARLVVRRDGQERTFEVPVRELDMMPRA